jgi:hypothetical protein
MCGTTGSPVAKTGLELDWLAEDSLATSSDLHTRLRHLIHAGRLTAGMKLPSERQIAERLSVARGTVRAALARLQEEGLIHCAHGKTRRVADPASGFKPAPPGPGALASAVVVFAEMPSPEQHANFSAAWDPFIQLSAAHLLQEAGYQTLTVHPRQMAARSPSLVEDRPAGVLAMHEVGVLGERREHLQTLVDAGIPVIAYGSDPGLEPFDRVVSDHFDGSYQLTKWLISQGRRRILRLWRFPQRRHWLDERDRGYEQAMREAGLEPIPPVRTPELPDEVFFPEEFEHVVRVLVGYLYEHVKSPQGLDAVVTATDKHACEVIAAL